MTTLRVTITVDADGNTGQYPAMLTWRSEHRSYGGNPRYYGDAIQQAIGDAFEIAMDGSTPFVDLRKEPTP